MRKSTKATAQIIDASGMTVMAGGVDIHSHVAGAEVNMGRMIRPEDHYKDPVAQNSAHPRRHRLLNSINLRHRLPILRNGLHFCLQRLSSAAQSKTRSRRIKRHTPNGQSNLHSNGDWWFVLENLAKGDIDECARLRRMAHARIQRLRNQSRKPWRSRILGLRTQRTQHRRRSPKLLASPQETSCVA